MGLTFGAVMSAMIMCKLVIYKAGFQLNTSPSMPAGLWRVDNPKDILYGSIVSICLPDGPILRMMLERKYIKPGSCASGAEPLLKSVVAIGGDYVSVNESGISTDRELIPESAARTVDGADRPLTPFPAGRYLVPADAYWAVAPYSWSFDSRYFGALPLDTIVGTAVPVIILRR